mmetsp:Transcript_4534/g.10469  ORF Transcript_4534/g.10469 Transcript_4534/m.10469 type:complete len:111 (+) Transcript_4534:814-1146(+)
MPTDVGEGRAHTEISAKYGVGFLCVAGSCRLPLATPTADGKHTKQGWGSTFVVTSVGNSAAATTGFMSTVEALHWRETNEACRWYRGADPSHGNFYKIRNQKRAKEARSE